MNRSNILYIKGSQFLIFRDKFFFLSNGIKSLKVYIFSVVINYFRILIYFVIYEEFVAFYADIVFHLKYIMNDLNEIQEFIV